VSRLVNCWCDEPSPGGLTKEPCARKATAEDMLCDVCRAGCRRVGILRANAAPVVLDAHAQVTGLPRLTREPDTGR
jgi:hypothetical protein